MNHQFKVDAISQIYANLRVRLDNERGNKHPKYTTFNNKNVNRKVFDNTEEVSGFQRQLSLRK